MGTIKIRIVNPKNSWSENKCRKKETINIINLSEIRYYESRKETCDDNFQSCKHIDRCSLENRTMKLKNSNRTSYNLIKEISLNCYHFYDWERNRKWKGVFIFLAAHIYRDNKQKLWNGFRSLSFDEHYYIVFVLRSAEQQILLSL